MHKILIDRIEGKVRVRCLPSWGSWSLAFPACLAFIYALVSLISLPENLSAREVIPRVVLLLLVACFCAICINTISGETTTFGHEGISHRVIVCGVPLWRKRYVREEVVSLSVGSYLLPLPGGGRTYYLRIQLLNGAVRRFRIGSDAQEVTESAQRAIESLGLEVARANSAH